MSWTGYCFGGERIRGAASSIWLLVQVGAALAASPAAASSDLDPAIPPDGELAFSVTRDGSPLGTHRVLFRRDDDAVQVDVAIDFEVRLAFLTLYSYTHTNRAVWDRDGLRSFDAQTVEDGLPIEARLRRAGDTYQIDGSAFARSVPAPLVPSTYWHPATRAGGRIVNTENGEVGFFTVQEVGVETVGTAAGPVEATRFRLSGAVEKDIWYAQGRWIASEFEAGGSTIRYTLTEGAADIVARHAGRSQREEEAWQNP